MFGLVVDFNSSNASKSLSCYCSQNILLVSNNCCVCLLHCIHSICLQLDIQCKELARKLDTVEHQLSEEKERADAADSNLKKKLEQV